MSAEIFYDNLDFTGGPPIRVLARVAVVKTEDGGRKGPFTKNYRPNHNFGSGDNRSFFIGQIEVPEGTWIHPGETHDLIIEFFNVRGLTDNLSTGRVWRIQEGSKLVARAEVLSVLKDDDIVL